jgi:hypothetical protein
LKRVFHLHVVCWIRSSSSGCVSGVIGRFYVPGCLDVKDRANIYKVGLDPCINSVAEAAAVTMDWGLKEEEEGLWQVQKTLHKSTARGRDRRERYTEAFEARQAMAFAAAASLRDGHWSRWR